MSAGPTEIGRYSSNLTGGIHPIRVQPETKALTINSVANAYPTDATDSKPSAVVSRGKRSRGLNARTVTIKFPETAPTGYKVGSPIRLPWFDDSTFGAIVEGQTGTYLAGSIVVVGTSAETAK